MVFFDREFGVGLLFAEFGGRGCARLELRRGGLDTTSQIIGSSSSSCSSSCRIVWIVSFLFRKIMLKVFFLLNRI